jgi:hypothetical protein
LCSFLQPPSASSLIQIFSAPVLKHPQSVFLTVREQVSHPYRTTGKIIVLYTVIHMFLDSR